MKERIEHMDLIKALNLYYLDNYSPKVIAEITNISHTTIYKYIKKIKENNLTWPIDESKLNNKTIEEYFYAAQNIRKDFNDEFEYTYRELKKHRHLTKLIVYNELIKSSKISISYSHFSKLYKQWSNTQTLSMRMDHIGGEIVYVDYAGLKLSIIMSDGLCYDCPVFVGTLGASGFVFVDITLTQSQEDWINSHIRMFVNCNLKCSTFTC